MKTKRVAVLGLGEFGRALAGELSDRGAEVLAVDVSAKRVDMVRDEVAVAAVADIRDAEALKELFTSTFDVAVVSIGGGLEASIMATLHLKSLPVKEIWAEANSPDRAEVLTRVGADKIIAPERDMGRRVAQQLANPDLVDFLPLTGDHGILECEAPGWSRGKTLAELELRKTMNVAVIAIRPKEGRAKVVPGGATAIQEDDVLTIVGLDDDLAKFQARTE